jgi:hypothetical protein
MRPIYIFTVLATAATSATAQSVSEHVVLGDHAYTARNDPVAFSQYNAAIHLDSTNVEALWKASRTASELGEFDTTRSHTLFVAAERYGHQAVALDSMNQNARAALAQVQGLMIRTLGPLDKISYAIQIYENATACLKINPRNPDCARALGIWNDRIMHVDKASRLAAVQFFGAAVFEDASWQNALQYLQQAVTAEPRRTKNHLQLARVYVDLDSAAKAKAEFEAAITAPVIDYNDEQYKAAAKKELRTLAKN